MSSKPVHMVGDKPVRLSFSEDVTTRCGLVGVPVRDAANCYGCISESGGEFNATTRKDLTTCRKCTNLISIGMIHRRPK